MLRGIVMMVGVGVLGSQELATAQEESPEVERLLDRGVELRRDGDNEGALRVFREAHGRAQTGRTHAQLGSTYQALGDWARAYEHLIEALDLGGAWVERYRDPLEESLAVVREHVGFLNLRGGIDGAAVQLNDRSFGPLPIYDPIPVRSGSAQLIVTAAGYQRYERIVTINAGETVLETIVLAPADEDDDEPAVPAPEAPFVALVDEPNPPSAAAGIAILSIGGASLVVSGVMYGLAVQRQNEYNSDTCAGSGDVPRSSQCGDQRSQSIAMRNASAGLLGGGAVLAAVGVVLIIRRRVAESPSLACAPGLTGIACSGRF